MGWESTQSQFVTPVDPVNMSENFEWTLFSGLLQEVVSMGVRQCKADAYNDDIEISVLDRHLEPEEMEEEGGTVHDKRILLIWSAHDMQPHYRRTRRDHELLLRSWFKGYNMTAMFAQASWTLSLWVPRGGTGWTHRVVGV